MIVIIDPGKDVYCKEWKYIDNKFQVITQSKCISKRLVSLLSDWDIVLTHINIKHSQSAQFQADLKNPINAHVLEIVLQWAILVSIEMRYKVLCVTDRMSCISQHNWPINQYVKQI